MLDLAFSVVWLLVVIVAILDCHLQLKAMRAELERERAETAKERSAAAQRHMSLARVSQEQHVEMLCILRANIVPDRVSGGIDACTEPAPVTPREPAITRSQRPPAPALDWKDTRPPGVGPPDGESSVPHESHQSGGKSYAAETERIGVDHRDRPAPTYASE